MKIVLNNNKKYNKDSVHSLFAKAKIEIFMITILLLFFFKE